VRSTNNRRDQVAVALLFNVPGSTLNLHDELCWFDNVLRGYAMFACTLVVALFAYGVVLSGAREQRLSWRSGAWGWP
jgi:hypothetical protein